MLVGDIMTSNPVKISEDMPVPAALALMHEKKIRSLPVVDAHDRLLGIVTEKDLLYVSPSPATSLNIWEIKELLGKVRVEGIMVRKVITVTEDTPIEEAARLMADDKIGSLPVLRDKTLIGIVTKTDLFNIFLAVLGGLRPGVRVTALTSGAKGTVAKITNAIYGLGGDIVGLAFNEVTNESEKGWQITLKVQDVALDTLVTAIKPLVIQIQDAREI